MTAALAPEDFDDLHEFIRVQMAAGYAPIADLVDEAVEVFADTSLPTDALRGAAQTLAEQALATHLAEQAGWPETTDCDRLDAFPPHHHRHRIIVPVPSPALRWVAPAPP